MPEQRLFLFGDYACPFCRIAEAGVARLRTEGRIRVEGVAYELRPAGTPLPDPDTAWTREYWTRTVEPLAAELGVPMRRPSLMVRTRKAHEAAAYARGEGKYAAMHEAIYTAYWQGGLDIGRIDVLAGIGRDIGLDMTALKVALDIDQCTGRVEEDEAWAVQLRLGAVPAYVMTPDRDGGTTVAVDIRLGLQQYDELRAWVERDDDI